jgi:predicted TIM-barrel fold metal-dependent hydrolase
LLEGVFSGNGEMDLSNLTSAFVFIKEHPEWWDRETRLKLMDEQGLQGIVILPSTGIANIYDYYDMPEALNANIRALNRWMEEAWGFGADGRIYSVPVLTLLDLDWAIEELERVAGLGSRFFWLAQAPINGKSPADPSFDPFWARVEEIGIKLVFHVGHEGFTDIYGTHWGEAADRYITEYSALQHFLCFGERPITDTIAALILQNLFGRFPGIQAISIENGSAWLPHLCKSMDKAWRMGRGGNNIGGALDDLPSEIFRNHFYVNPFHEEDIVGLVEAIGAERVLFGSDYPHPEGLANPLRYAEGLVEKVTETDFRRIMYGNAASLLGL